MLSSIYRRWWRRRNTTMCSGSALLLQRRRSKKLITLRYFFFIFLLISSIVFFWFWISLIASPISFASFFDVSTLIDLDRFALLLGAKDTLIFHSYRRFSYPSLWISNFSHFLMREGSCSRLFLLDCPCSLCLICQSLASYHCIFSVVMSNDI